MRRFLEDPILLLSGNWDELFSKVILCQDSQDPGRINMSALQRFRTETVSHLLSKISIDIYCHILLNRLSRPNSESDSIFL